MTFPFPDWQGVGDHPELARMRREDPVPLVPIASGGTAYLATRYPDVRRVLMDPVFSRAAAAARQDAAVLTQLSRLPPVLMNLDPPDHTRIRKLVARAFSAGAVENLRPAATRIAADLVDDLIKAGPPADFLHDFARPFPARVICALLGVSDVDRHRLRSLMDITLATTDRAEVGAAFGEIMGLIADLVATKRESPADDLVSSLIAVRDAGDQLSEPELLYTVLNLCTGGYEPVAGALSNSLLALSPAQLDRLTGDLSLLPGALEELLRYVPVFCSAKERVALEDVELSGVHIPAGSTVIPVTPSANHDAAHIPDPGHVDLTRTSPHLAFGHGVHRCVAIPLAMMELEIAYTTLLTRLPGLRPTCSVADLVWKTGLVTVGPTSLPITWRS
ncbi:Cytochrome P450 [Amycolatopsis xylanica]|uniref:Cytochrome P450 n=1 Tax=Amycolatopsis xylanica TaxID=589385 RepID=A0A1H3RUM5_9PSEU|nr:cytochrome P450 [Amycolatopsis xylanica]SDZ29377.1 Cytochrome P450 [Amycolatopsis xylanica]